MYTIVANKEKGFIKMLGQYFQVGCLRPEFDGNKLEIFDTRESNRSPLTSGTFDKYIDPETDEPFASLAALIDFVEDNFFFELGDGSGGGGGTIESPYVSEKFNIPGGFSGTLSSSRLEGLDLHFIKIFSAGLDGGSDRNPANYDYDAGAGTLDLSALELATGDTVIIIGKEL